MRLQRIDSVVIARVAVGVCQFLLHDPVERISSLDAHPVGGREGGARDQRPQLDELVRRDSNRAEGRARADELDVAAHPHGLAPPAQDLPGRRLDSDEACERLAPLIAPHFEVHVDDVVVRDGDMAQRVRNGERPRLVARVEVPDDAHRVAAALNAVRPSRTRLERRLVPAAERNAALGDRRVHERLAFPQRNVAIAEVEVTRERHFEALAHAERSVLLDVDRDVGREQREAVSRSGARESQRYASGQSKTADE